ncbi:uncharacterized protein C8A04DRAFT_15706 [Dichotomopilus funicola]|uniref:F-box domain-containing protein n=1 Tax=Dichotomopilus funicola TaxID=1934379 RepID=A0AAN6UXG1_9PEZI|nr:hypothetical protein C8A04DRAFT_15706 [Dichotomopilus funicola]
MAPVPDEVEPPPLPTGSDGASTPQIPLPALVQPPSPSLPDPVVTQGSNFIHGLIGLSPGGFSETVRNSISSLARRDHDATAVDVVHLKPDSTSADVGAGALLTRSKSKGPLSMGLPPAPEPRPRHLLALPHEILLLIILRLDFADIVRLRKTCKALHSLASPQQIRRLFGPVQLRLQLLGHCKNCLLYDPFRSRLLQPTVADHGYPLASCCLDCAVKDRDPRIRVGKRINLANMDTVWVCRWCGFPIVEGGAFGCEQMHRFCYKRYNDALFVFFLLGWLQLGLGIVAAALAWRYFRDDILVFAPTVTNFLLLWICLGFIICRGNVWRTYHFTLVLEFLILGLWIPPIYSIAAGIAKSPDAHVEKSTKATLAMFALNTLFRLLNLIGNILLLGRLDTTSRNRSAIPAWRRPLHSLATALVMWTYPQSLEQKLPPDFL